MNRIHKELVGRKYGFLRVTFITKEMAIGCVCTCGRYVIVSYAALADGSVISCGCMGGNAQDVQMKVLYKSAPAIFVAVQAANLKASPTHLPDLDAVSEPDNRTLNCPEQDSPFYQVQAIRGNKSFTRPHMLEKNVGALTVLAAALIVPAMPVLLSFAAGAMLYVVVEELIPEMSAGEHSNIGVVFFAVGFSLMMALDVALG